MEKLVSIQEIKALEVYLRLMRKPSAYDVQEDLHNLMYWLDLTSNQFALRLKKEYPLLTIHELNLCCLLRMGYSLEDMGIMMKVKDTTIRRYIYRTCDRLHIKNNKKDFEAFISRY